MIEVLIAIVVAAVGLLGVIGLHAKGIANTHNAATQTRALISARSMADRMRANQAGLAGGGYADIDQPSDGEPPRDCAAKVCTPAQMAAHDAYIWGQRLARVLPGGAGTVVCNQTPCGSDSQYGITVTWQRQDKAGSGRTQQQLTLVVDP